MVAPVLPRGASVAAVQLYRLCEELPGFVGIQFCAVGGIGDFSTGQGHAFGLAGKIDVEVVAICKETGIGDPQLVSVDIGEHAAEGEGAGGAVGNIHMRPCVT